MKPQRNSPSLGSWLRHREALLMGSLLPLFLGGSAWALDPHRPISPYAHTVWRTQDGFPRGAHMITQTRDGYVWIAASGLIRFDGITMTPVLPVLPQRMGFRYMLEGRDKRWQNPGLRRQAFYSDLRPGSYRFRVTESNKDGVWNETGATLDFNVAATWYQTIWFRSLCFVACVLVLWAVHRIRVRQIAAAMKARFDERLAERTRIARDLLDTLLQTIQGSKLVADDALSAPHDLPYVRHAVEKLSAWLARATEEGRAALNSLRTSAAEANDLAGALRRALDECRIQGSMEVSIPVSGQIQEMHPIVRDEIYRIGYEAIRNACVHSRASQLKVEITYGRDLSLRISDNGVGIDPDILRGGKPGHFGLQAMGERAARIMGKFSVESAAGAGTVITLTVPGGIIYRTLNA
jgi:signal transduction histidine kinase